MAQGSIVGLDKLLRKLEELNGNVDEALLQGINLACAAVTADAKSLSPVLTGNLRRSITYEIDAAPGMVTGVVGTNIEYAAKVEFGSSESWEGFYRVLKAGNKRRTRVKKTFARKIAKPFLFPALDMNRNNVQKYIIKAFRTEIRKVADK